MQTAHEPNENSQPNVIPAIPVADIAPEPAPTLSYADSPAALRRPWPLTLLGRLSVIIGALGIIYALAEGGIEFRRYAQNYGNYSLSYFLVWLQSYDPNADAPVSDAIVGMFVNSYLLICGLFALYKYRGARTMHMVYGLMKVPVLLVTIGVLLNDPLSMPPSVWIFQIIGCGYPALVLLDIRRAAIWKLKTAHEMVKEEELRKPDIQNPR